MNSTLVEPLRSLGAFRQALREYASESGMELSGSAMGHFSAAFLRNCASNGIPNQPTIEAAAKRAIALLQEGVRS